MRRPNGSCQGAVLEAGVGKPRVKEKCLEGPNPATTAQRFLLTGRLYWLFGCAAESITAALKIKFPFSHRFIGPDSSDVADAVLYGVVLGLHDIADSGVQSFLILHLRLELQVLQIEAHLCLLHLLCGVHQVCLAAAPRRTNCVAADDTTEDIFSETPGLRWRHTWDDFPRYLRGRCQQIHLWQRREKLLPNQHR